MKHYWSHRTVHIILFFASLSATAGAIHFIPNLKHFQDKSGAVATFNANGGINEKSAFFQSLGTNGRSCATCHRPDQAFGLSAQGAREAYRRTHGLDPLFASVDGANCPTATPEDRSAHSLILQRGLFRITLTMPANAQFTIAAVHDPYGCAIANDPATGRQTISVYRRTLPSTNLRFLSAVMFDGRETLLPLNSRQTFQNNLRFDLTDQALSAVMGHAQASVEPTPEQLAEIVDVELGFSTAQVRDDNAGPLHHGGATGGPQALSVQQYYPGINDALGGDPTGAKFNPTAFSLFATWETADADDRDFWGDRRKGSEREAARVEIAAGEKIFNTQPAIITDVHGLNDNPALGSPATITGTCSTCHDTPNVGNHSVALALDIGTSRQTESETDPAIVAALRQLSAPDLPVYEIRGCTDPLQPGEPVNYYTSDPGRAMITGRCADMNLGKGPILRGLAARAPYFHNGAAANLQELVDFYNQRFQMGLTSEQKKELIAFLDSL
jgi:cytochrome c peroxidase